MTLKKFELCMSISFISLYVYVNVKGVTYALEGELHPALLLHWRVQAYLVGYLDPDSRREYRGLLPGLRINGRPLRAFTMNWRVVVEGWISEAPSDPP